MNALAVVLQQPEELTLSRLDLDAATDDDLVVDIEWSGISTGTERLLWTGRMPAFPGMGYPLVPGYESVGWSGVWVPKGTPQPIIDKLHAALTASQDSAEVEKQFASEGATVVKKSPTEFGAFMVSEMNKWEQVVKKGGITAQ